LALVACYAPRAVRTAGKPWLANGALTVGWRPSAGCRRLGAASSS